MVEALSPDASETTLADPILCRAAIIRSYLLDACRCGNAGESESVLTVAIADQVLRVPAACRCLAQLLRCSHVDGVTGHPGMHDAARGDLDDEEGVERSEE